MEAKVTLGMVGMEELVEQAFLVMGSITPLVRALMALVLLPEVLS
jgi:threonine/homoserine efflux transporter RhtA